MDITLQVHHGGAWHDAARIEFLDPAAGIAGATLLDYDVDYVLAVALEGLQAGHGPVDARALSVRLPVDVTQRRADHWPAFLLDLMPQGHARRSIAELIGVDPNAPGSELQLLLHAGVAPVGNVRVAGALERALDALGGTRPEGLDMDEILARGDRFRDLAGRFAMIASGSSALQGEWPKVALTRAGDGLWYPDSLVPDGDAREHVIVKLIGSGDREDALILEAEAGYLGVAQELGLDVPALPRAGDGVLVVPRFDRRVTNAGVERLGQESLVAALGVSRFGYVGRHEDYLEVIRNTVAEPELAVAEYVLRDAVNLAMGNTDNHGRNTALSKTVGEIRLAPLFDFAPMRLARQTIVRSTKWHCMRDRGSDYAPDWARVCRAAAGEDLEAEAIARRLLNAEERIRRIPEIAGDMGVPADVIEQACARAAEVADDIARLDGAVLEPC